MLLEFIKGEMSFIFPKIKYQFWSHHKTKFDKVQHKVRFLKIEILRYKFFHFIWNPFCFSFSFGTPLIDIFSLARAVKSIIWVFPQKRAYFEKKEHISSFASPLEWLSFDGQMIGPIVLFWDAPWIFLRYRMKEQTKYKFPWIFTWK